MATTNPDLPEAILVEIFSRLPTKSVGRFRCLSKSWRRDLSSTYFIKKHTITRQQTTQQENLVLANSCTEYLEIVTSLLKNDEQVRIWDSFPWKFRYRSLFGACNGLLLVRPEHFTYDDDDYDTEDDDDDDDTVDDEYDTEDDDDEYGTEDDEYDTGDDDEYDTEDDEEYESSYGMLLVNLITLQQATIPNSPRVLINLSRSTYSRVYGFGYDWDSDDFKVVILTSIYPCDEHVHKADTIVDVLSVNKGVWNRLDNVYPYGELVPPHAAVQGTNGVFVNGAVHWFICERESGFYTHIAAFDLATEVFHEIPIPPKYNRNSLREVESALVVIGGCLSIVYNIRHCDERISGVTDVWMMKEYGVVESWVRFHIPRHEFGLSIMPLCLVGDEQLVCCTENEYLVECDLKDGTTKKLIVGGEQGCYRDGVAFVDSLMSPGKSDCDDGSWC